MIDEATKGKHENITSVRDDNGRYIPNVDNVNNWIDVRPTGNTRQAGLRRIAKERQRLNALTNQPQNSQKIDYLENQTDGDTVPQIFGERENGEPLVKILTNCNNGKATQRAAEIFHTNRQYVSDAKKLVESAPVLFQCHFSRYSLILCSIASTMNLLIAWLVRSRYLLSHSA